ncbi:MAG: UpxY family transcription antiterminator [Bacteroidales bacterium]|nr:UpxY family transcription antiterminator [Bacteroidales bacterium]MDD4604398.1 UpxY family transcription antiterminator [Bacteroidales bacterium]
MKHQRFWYAVYTKSRQEKALMERLLEIGIEAYVPLQKVVRQWSDRKKLVEVPLIHSYCFVKILPTEYFTVLNTFGAVRYIWFSGKPAPIPDRQIDLLKVLTGSDVPVESIPAHNLPPGTKVRITAGPLIGLEGELILHSGKSRVIVRIDHLEQVLSVSISPMLIEKIT